MMIVLTVMPGDTEASMQVIKTTIASKSSATVTKKNILRSKTILNTISGKVIMEMEEAMAKATEMMTKMTKAKAIIKRVKTKTINTILIKNKTTFFKTKMVFTIL